MVLLDWGNTVMRVLPQHQGPMEHWPEVEAMPGIREALEYLHQRYLLALATNAADSGEDAIWRALQRADLGRLFHHVFCVANVGQEKPSPGFFRTILVKLGIAPSAAVMVGDGWGSDVQGALSAGLAAIWYNPHSRDARAGPRLRSIHHLQELPATVAALLGGSA